MNSFFSINVCRVCLQNEQNCGLSDKDTLEKFEFTTRLKISEDDNLPKTMCLRCTTRLQVAYSFIKTAHESEKSLHKFIEKICAEFKEVTQSKKCDNKFINDQNLAEDDLLSLLNERTREEALTSDSISGIENCSFSKNVLLIHASNEIDDSCETSPHFLEIPAQEDDTKQCYNEEGHKIENNKVYANMNTLESNEESEVHSQSTEFAIEENHDYDMMINTQDDATQCRSIYSDEATAEGNDQKYDDINLNNLKEENEHLFKEEEDDKGEQTQIAIIPKTGHFESRFYCNKCNRDFSTKTNLNRHMQSHEGNNRPFSCTKCKKSFTQKSTLKQHMYTHTGERPYVCEVCNRGFTQCKSLMFHMRRHTGEKPFHCEYCLITFRQKDALRIHILKHHVIIERDTAGIEIFSCIICQKKFDTKVEFKMHMKVHTANAVESNRTKKFQCRKCFKCFSLKKSLIRHMCIHNLDDDDFSKECFNCDLAFSSAEEYQEHLSGCHQYACAACPQLVFQTVQELKIHMYEHELEQEGQQQ